MKKGGSAPPKIKFPDDFVGQLFELIKEDIEAELELGEQKEEHRIDSDESAA